MATKKSALDRLDAFLRTYPIRILKGQTLGGVTADYYCPLAGIALLLTDSKGDDPRGQALNAQGLSVLTLSHSAISRSFDGASAYIDDNIKHALTNKR